MSKPQVTVERRIAAPRERVWHGLTDLTGWPAVLSGVERVEVLSDGPFGVGTRWRETRRMFGKEATEEMWVTACTAPERYVVEADSHHTHYVSEFTLRAEGPDVTVVRLTFAAQPPGGVAGLLAKVFGALGSKAVAKALAKDLADVAASVEARPSL
ncbi:SRPBCC family protein [Streptomyces sp. NPDC060194]|uniref:SRPBCC family protein n=1 Tax=Streptomyces sp. NPDC060194 TaxID=3347069 RepID=UPI003668838E